MIKGIGIALWILGVCISIIVSTLEIELYFKLILLISIVIIAFINGALFYGFGEIISSLKEIRRYTKDVSTTLDNTYKLHNELVKRTNTSNTQSIKSENIYLDKQILTNEKKDRVIIAGRWQCDCGQGNDLDSKKCRKCGNDK